MIEFRGNWVIYLRQVGLFILILGPLVAVVMVGGAWPWVFAASLLPILPFLGLFVLIVGRWDRFRFDDGKRVVLRPLRKPLAYETINGFALVRTGPLFYIEAITGRFGRPRLLMAGDGRDLDHAMAELEGRFSEVSIEERSFPVYGLLAGVGAAILFVQLTFVYYLSTTSPGVSVSCEPMQLPAATPAQSDGEVYRLPGVGFTAPAEFRLVQGDERAGRYVFESTSNEQLLIVQRGLLADMADGEGTWLVREPETGRLSPGVFFYVMGVSDSFDLLKLVYCERFGVIPLVLKGVLLSSEGGDRAEQIGFHEFEEEGYEGLIHNYTLDGRGRAEILIRHGETYSEIALSIRGGGPIEPTQWASLVRGVRFDSP